MEALEFDADDPMAMLFRKLCEPSRSGSSKANAIDLTADSDEGSDAESEVFGELSELNLREHHASAGVVRVVVDAVDPDIAPYIHTLPLALLKRSEKNRRSRPILKQFQNPKVWITLLHKALGPPLVVFDIPQYQKLWAYAVSKVNVEKDLGFTHLRKENPNIVRGEDIYRLAREAVDQVVASLDHRTLQKKIRQLNQKKSTAAGHQVESNSALIRGDAIAVDQPLKAAKMSDVALVNTHGGAAIKFVKKAVSEAKTKSAKHIRVSSRLNDQLQPTQQEQSESARQNHTLPAVPSPPVLKSARDVYGPRAPVLANPQDLTANQTRASAPSALMPTSDYYSPGPHAEKAPLPACTLKREYSPERAESPFVVETPQIPPSRKAKRLKRELAPSPPPASTPTRPRAMASGIQAPQMPAVPSNKVHPDRLSKMINAHAHPPASTFLSPAVPMPVMHPDRLQNMNGGQCPFPPSAPAQLLPASTSSVPRQTKNSRNRPIIPATIQDAIPIPIPTGPRSMVNTGTAPASTQDRHNLNDGRHRNDKMTGYIGYVHTQRPDLLQHINASLYNNPPFEEVLKKSGKK